MSIWNGSRYLRFKSCITLSVSISHFLSFLGIRHFNGTYPALLAVSGTFLYFARTIFLLCIDFSPCDTYNNINSSNTFRRRIRFSYCDYRFLFCFFFNLFYVILIVFFIIFLGTYKKYWISCYQLYSLFTFLFKYNQII